MAAFASAASSFAASTPLEKFLTCSSTADTRLASGLVLPSTTSTPATKPMARHAMKPPHDAAETGLFVTVVVIDRTGVPEHVRLSFTDVHIPSTRSFMMISRGSLRHILRADLLCPAPADQPA